MTDDLRALQEDLTRHENRRAEPSRPPGRSLGHQTNTRLLIIIFALILSIVIIIMQNTFFMDKLQDRIEEQKMANDRLNEELAHYKEAYETVLSDVQAFGRIYNTTYSENGTITPDELPAQTITLPERNAWSFYHEQGTISDTCLLTTKLVETESDVVEFSLVATAKNPVKLALMVDASLVATFLISGTETVHQTRVLIPRGTHYVDIVNRDGNKVTVSTLRIGNRLIENGASVIDEGQGFQMFDCKNSKETDTFTDAGAMRFKIEKI